MSAPLVINLRDGSVWERRGVTPEGVALYALAGSCRCPEYLLATEAELAAQGIAGTADVLPVPQGPELEPAELEALRAQLAKLKAMRADEHDDLSAAVGYTSGLAWADLVGIAATNTTSLVQAERDVRALRARVAELESERHVTNEALDDAVKALRADRAAMVCRECNAPVMWVEGVNDSWWNHTQPAEDGHSIVPRPLVRSSADESADRLTRLLAPSQVLREDAAAPCCHLHKAPVCCDPEDCGPCCMDCPTCPVLVRQRAVEPAAKCRCDEPDADPYQCEAVDCHGEFSELNPFGGGPVEGHDAKVSRTCGCGWRTSVWHVADGSADEELHGHVVRVHGGVYPKAGAE